MLLKDSPIQTVADLKGKLVGFKSGQQPPWLAAMLTKVALTFNDIKLVPVGFDPRVILPDFGAGRVDAVQIFKSNEPDTMTRQGFAVKVFNPEDSGVHYLGQVYITHKDFIRDDPEMVRKFVRATMKSLTFVLDPANAKEVTDMVMKYAAKDANRDHNQLMWQTEIKALTGPGTKEVGLGYANDDEWNTMQQMLVTYGAMKAAVPLNQMWDPQFVKSIYKDGKLIGP
jgi:ABC-type nitrate/sulfonate/bicarbonate transport system substrate-binding protein